MKNTKKVFAILFVVLGVCCLIMGFCFGKISDNYKGASAGMGRFIDGKLVMSETGTIGGNSEGVKKFKTSSTLAYAFGAMFIICGGFDMLKLKLEKKTPIQKKAGKVIEKQGCNIVIQDIDGKRESFVVEQGVIITNGDVGYFEMRNKRIIGFTPIKNKKSGM